ncbi:hypothetical protein ATZ33_02415 [Enterococcus silesiacus]|uniref:Uncharacterized protein n=1 Tax=Enterococcus silesiacus TaxID=332949 RepID=A0A0S3K7L6_9ENTE|nr:hypothetical protein [Enterococcus silesiacus]ALS00270.1 hypothetical protein ATZ33_02415 [Enterococcus silesiacus]OJG93253.1 hypothetical protein RV15_GL001285 [Enterococcus silesiacus]
MAVLLHPTKIKRFLFGYWLAIPLLFGVYSLILAAVQNVSVGTIFKSISSLTLTSIVVLLLFFQLFGLYILGDSSDCRHSLLGTYLKFSLIQQLCSFNIPGFLLCLLFYRSLLNAKEDTSLSKQGQWTIYGLMGFVGLLSILIVWIRLSL